MTWFEALDILDGCAVGPMRDSRYHFEALRVIAGYPPVGDKTVPLPHMEAPKLLPE